MKNLIGLFIFGVIVFIASLFDTEKEQRHFNTTKTIEHGQITILENKRKLLYNEICNEIRTNSTTLDSIKNNR